MAERTARKSVSPTSSLAMPAESLRGRVPTLAAPQAEALRRFYGAPQRWFLEDGGQVAFTPGHAGTAAETFVVDADGTPLLLRLESGAPPQAGLRWNDYSGRSRMLAWSLAHESQLMRLSNLLGISLLPTAPAADAPPNDADSLWLGVTIYDDVAADALPPAPTRGALRMPNAWLDRVLARAEPVYEDDPLPELTRWLGLPGAVHVAFAGPRLDAGTWHALKRGDVILIGDRKTPVFEARSSQRAWPVTSAPNGWRVEGPPRPAPTRLTTALPLPEQPKMTETETASEDTATETGSEDRAAPQPARGHRVRDRPDRAEHGDLASLQPGYVFPLASHLEGANVTIRANGHAAGRVKSLPSAIRSAFACCPGPEETTWISADWIPPSSLSASWRWRWRRSSR